MSKPSVMPPGGVQVLEVAKVCAVTSIVSATVVVMLGVACVKPLAVTWPFSTSIGVVVSKLEKDWMAPGAKVGALISKLVAESHAVTTYPLTDTEMVRLCE